MRRTRLLRLFWIGAAAILVAAALVALAAVVGGRFDETDGKILGTLGTALLAGAVATAGAALVEARTSAPFGLAVAVTAPVWFAVATAAIWLDFSENLGRAAGTGFVIFGAELIVAVARLLVGGRRSLLLLFGATAGCVGIGALITIVMIWRDHGDGASVKAAAAFWILGVLGFLLIPVARRLATPATGGPRRVDLARLARCRPGETLYLVLDGRARLAELELEPGEAAVATAAPEPEPGARVVAIK